MLKSNILKKIISSCLVSICCFSISINVFAADESRNVSSDQLFNCDALPQEFDANTPFLSIEASIMEYISFAGLEIEKGSGEYLDLMYSFLYGEVENITDLTSRYFGDYASVYVVKIQEQEARNEMQAQSDTVDVCDVELIGTIQQTKQNNIERQNRLMQEGMNSVQTRSANFDVSKAQRYAKDYALGWNYVYGRYSSDCTNFASQIVHHAGMPMVTGVWQWNGDETAKYNWNVAHAFTEYWTLVRGYNGGDYTTRASVNNNAYPGDFVAYMRTDTYEIWHVAFVQSKSNGLIYISQHTTDRYNEKWNDISLGHDSVFIIIKFR